MRFVTWQAAWALAAAFCALQPLHVAFWIPGFATAAVYAYSVLMAWWVPVRPVVLQNILMEPGVEVRSVCFWFVLMVEVGAFFCIDHYTSLMRSSAAVCSVEIFYICKSITELS
jgi:hypothetical protein